MLVFSFTDEFVNGQARLEYTINGDSQYVFMEKVGETYQTPITSQLAQCGSVDLQLVITEGTDENEIPKFKSNVFYLPFGKSINAEIEQPEETEEWIDIANTKLNQVDNVDIDITTIDDVTKVEITRKDGTKKEAIVNGSVNSIIDVLVDNKSVVKDNIANIDLSNKVDKVEGKVLSTNDFTNDDKEKLDGLSNYNDTKIKEEIESKQDELISGQNIKTINNQSILGSGNIIIESSSGGSSNYEDLNNKPSINDIELKGNKTLEELGIQPIGNYATEEYVENEIATFDFIKVVDALPEVGLENRIYFVPKIDAQTQDLFDEYVWINNKWEWITTKQIEVDLTDYVKNADYATSSKAGLVRPANGLFTSGNTGALLISKASEAQIDAKTDNYYPIVSSNLEYAVKSVGDGYYAEKEYVDEKLGDIESLLSEV
jgi:hypothetical protein